MSSSASSRHPCVRSLTISSSGSERWRPRA